MIEQPFKSVTYAWLAETGDAASGMELNEFGQPGWISYPMSSEIGHGGYELIELSLGMSIVRSSLSFSPAVVGQYMPLMNVDVDFHEPTFQAMVLTGMRGTLKERFPVANLAVSQGMDLFRHTQRYSSAFSVDATYSGEGCHISVACAVLERLIGQQETALILESLAITQAPAIAAHAIPQRVSSLLKQAAGGGLSGNLRRLFAQAKILEYLASLVEYFGTGVSPEPARRQKSLERAHEIHKKLLASDGKLPTLDELASQYGRSAKSLNDEFSQEFGKSIFAFVSDHRLLQAHEALQHSDVSIKQLAARLGYAHVSNFAIAFKRRFGYPPGTLRKN